MGQAAHRLEIAHEAAKRPSAHDHLCSRCHSSGGPCPLLLQPPLHLPPFPTCEHTLALAHALTLAHAPAPHLTTLLDKARARAQTHRACGRLEQRRQLHVVVGVGAGFKRLLDNEGVGKKVFPFDLFRAAEGDDQTLLLVVFPDHHLGVGLVVVDVAQLF